MPENTPDTSIDHKAGQSFVKVVRKLKDGTLKTLCRMQVRAGEEITVTVDANAITDITF